VIRLKQYKDVDLMIGLFHGEARQIEDTKFDEIKEYLAIGNTVMNRVTSPGWRDTPRGVILQPNQFSCYNPGDPSYKSILKFLKEKGVFYRRLKIYASKVLEWRCEDFSKGANHYVAVWFYETTKSTHWCRQMKITAIYGGHIFLKG